jgi:hypothetical protein
MDAFAFSNVREKQEQSAVALSVVVVGVVVEVEVGRVVVVKISKADGGKEDKISLVQIHCCLKRTSKFEVSKAGAFSVAA